MSSYTLPASEFAQLIERLLPICPGKKEDGPHFIHLRELNGQLLGEATNRYVYIGRYANTRKDCPEEFALRILPSDAKRILAAMGTPKRRRIDESDVTLEDGNTPSITIQSPDHHATYYTHVPDETFPPDAHKLAAQCKIQPVPGHMTFNPAFIALTAGTHPGQIGYWGTDHSNVVLFSTDDKEIGLVIGLRFGADLPQSWASAFRK